MNFKKLKKCNSLKDFNNKYINNKNNIDKLTISELDEIVKKVCNNDFPKAATSADFLDFIDIFINYLNNNQIIEISKNLDKFNLFHSEMESFISSNIDILNENCLPYFLNYFVNEKAFNTFFYFLNKYFYKIDKNYVFKVLKEDISICDNTNFAEFIKNNFNPFDNNFIEIIDSYFKLENVNNTRLSFKCSLLKVLKPYFINIKKLLIDNVFNNNINVLVFLNLYKDDLNDEDFKEILLNCDSQYSFVKLAKAVLSINKSTLVLDYIVDKEVNMLKESNEEKFIEILTYMKDDITKEYFEKIKDLLLNCNIRTIFKFISLTEIFDSDLIQKIIDSGGPELIYDTSLLIKEKNISLNQKESLKKALKESRNDYYIILYGINVDSSILVEYYEDTMLIISLITLFNSTLKDETELRKIKKKINYLVNDSK